MTTGALIGGTLRDAAWRPLLRVSAFYFTDLTLRDRVAIVSKGLFGTVYSFDVPRRED